ncbi:MAG TPA: hypothetical protein DHV36_16150 [Desulfobacteraceae bacterium]|nr:hypothetical protein [Desulfobacteraceae bacterium]|tara:strand:+ start:812 stop:1018 length:207 start_codon:yes stop_codon:yes gene_type:complete
MSENEDVWAVWHEVRTQWRGGAMGVIGLDYAEVREAFRELEIPYSRRNKRKIQTIERVILDHVNSSDK